MLCSLYLVRFIPEPIYQYQRKTVKERFPDEANLLKEFLAQSSLSKEGFISQGTELFSAEELSDKEIIGASGKFYVIKGEIDKNPVIKYCTRDQAKDMILGSMLFRRFFLNHDDYVYVDGVLNKCFDSQITVIYLGEFMSECKIVDEEFANDIDNQKREGVDYSDLDREYQWAKENIIDGENR